MQRVNPVTAFLFCMMTLCFGLLVGSGLMANAVVTHWQREAIKRDYAQYDQKTGAWKWKEAGSQ